MRLKCEEQMIERDIEKHTDFQRIGQGIYIIFGCRSSTAQHRPLGISVTAVQKLLDYFHVR
jgi:hypothetical protein